MARTGRAAGFTMLEVLISIFIMTIGLLGLAGMQVRAQQAELESYQRAQALILLNDMVDRINANRSAAGCYAFTSAATGSPFAGAGGGGAPVCGAYGTTETRTRANTDLSEWHNTLNGASEQVGTANVGAMEGARGCVSLDSTVTPNLYRVSVAWQGAIPTRNPTDIDAALTCGTGQYGGDEAIRRVISVTFPVACLSC
jgi:type IV pilus assembly protein PilV